MDIQVMPALVCLLVCSDLLGRMEWMLLSHWLQPAESATYKCSANGWAVQSPVFVPRHKDTFHQMSMGSVLWIQTVTVPMFSKANRSDGKPYLKSLPPEIRSACKGTLRTGLRTVGLVRAKARRENFPGCLPACGNCCRSSGLCQWPSCYVFMSLLCVSYAISPIW